MRSLEGKVAIVYGAAGSVGSAVAKAFHDAGARLFLAGRRPEGLATLNSELQRGGAETDSHAVDAYDPSAVTGHMRQILAQAGKIDIVFNAVTYGDIQGASLAELDFAAFSEGIGRAVAAQFSVAQAAARIMIPQESGLIATIVGHGHPHPGMGTTAVSWGLVEVMLRQWAADLGPSGIRVCWLRTAGFRESIMADRDYGSSWAGDVDAREILRQIDDATLLGRAPSVSEAGRAAIYLACAEGLTASAINLTAGAVAD